MIHRAMRTVQDRQRAAAAAAAAVPVPAAAAVAPAAAGGGGGEGGNATEKLKKRYREIFEALRKIHVCGVRFENVIEDICVREQEATHLLKECHLSFYDATKVSKIQLRDISGIAANGLSHYLAFLWAKDSDRFALNNYKNVFVITSGNLKCNTSEPAQVKKAILETYEKLTGETTEFKLDDIFWKETLFIIANYDGKELKWLNCKANVLVIGENYSVRVHQNPISGFLSYDIGLFPPKMDLIYGTIKTLSGTTVLKKEREVRETLLRRTDATYGVINFTNPFLIRSVDGEISVVGTERKVKHHYELVKNMEDMVLRVWKCEELADTVPQVFTDVVDWYSAAVTAKITDDSKEFYSYNVGGHLLIRGAGDNYFSYLGLISEMIPKITKEISENLISLVEQVIAEISDDSKWGENLLEKIVAHLKAKFSVKIASLDGSTTLFLSDAASSLTADPDERPSYKKFAHQLVGVDDCALTAAVRGILGNKVVEANPFIYTLVACLFIAEPARCPQTLLPTIMMLDLIEGGVVTWSDAIFQTDILTGDDRLDNDIGKTLLKFSGSFPMTQKSSYYQSKFMTGHSLGPDRQLMTWVEYKSSIIMFEWLELSLKLDQPRPVSDDVYWDSEIFSRFSERLANFSMLGSEEYGINFRIDLEAFEKMKSRLQTLPEGQTKYIVFSLGKGREFPASASPSGSDSEILGARGSAAAAAASASDSDSTTSPAFIHYDNHLLESPVGSQVLLYAHKVYGAKAADMLLEQCKDREFTDGLLADIAHMGIERTARNFARQAGISPRPVHHLLDPAPAVMPAAIAALSPADGGPAESSGGTFVARLQGPADAIARGV